MQQKVQNEDIFNYISELLATEDFRTAQSEFFEKNCHHFENEEENKHIYHEIFQEYAQILDNAIEAKLQLKFPNTDIAEFFEDFEKNYKSYKNQDTIEILFSFTDFDKFKASMLLFNKDQQGKSDSKEVKTEGGLKLNNGKNQKENVKDFGVLQKYYNIDLKQWKSVQKGKDEYDISIYSLPFENTGLDIIRVETIFQNCKLNTVFEILVDPENEQLKQSSKIKELRVVNKVSDDEKVILVRVNPPMLSQREMILQFLRNKISEDKYIIQIKSIELDEIPITKEYIRAEVFRAFQFTQQGKDVVISVVGYMDLKGYIPKMFMNMFMSKLISSGVRMKYKEILEKEKKMEQDIKNKN